MGSEIIYSFVINENKKFMRSYRVVFESYEGKNDVKRIVLTEGKVEKVRDVFNLGFSHKE
ncbi:hypothetical protein Bandiella_01606 (plasmid) [Candidatus Bandiella woodruffii]|uniref:Uncharacterized protein n=1 Tax=Candidatus Bandiella euplotis TaxID=1664265 RepID=A0ABZ0UMS9_9RICK|nr:hypothetical protein Bandiella_01606 [Candidatus Bandiella woodruffii]